LPSSGVRRALRPGGARIRRATRGGVALWLGRGGLPPLLERGVADVGDGGVEVGAGDRAAEDVAVLDGAVERARDGRADDRGAGCAREAARGFGEGLEPRGVRGVVDALDDAPVAVVGSRAGAAAVEREAAALAYDGNKLFKIPSTRLFRSKFQDNFPSSRRELGKLWINGPRIMENEFDLGEVEGFEDIPGRLDR